MQLKYIRFCEGSRYVPVKKILFETKQKFSVKISRIEKEGNK
jgi:uncharacterized protein YlxP (DUF503 family)